MDGGEIISMFVIKNMFALRINKINQTLHQVLSTMVDVAWEFR